MTYSYELAVADKTYSSGSLRGWLLFEAFGIPYKQHTALMYSDGFHEMLSHCKPARLVPAMKFDGTVVTDSLAMAETLAEQNPDLPIALALVATMDVIPQDEVARQVALGELSLDGKLIPVIGTFPAALAAAEAECNVNDLPITPICAKTQTPKEHNSRKSPHQIAKARIC